MRLQKIINSALLLAGLVTLLGVGSASAQDRPGIDRPIRVGMFKGTNSGSYYHTNIQTAGTQLALILASPKTTGLGDSLLVPSKGFTFTQYGITGTAQSPTATQVTEFINALDTLDVAYIGAFVNFGATLSNATQRQKLADFWTTKGFLTSHATNDSYGTWAPLDTIQAARFQNHPSGDRTATIKRDSVAALDSSWKFLNRSLLDTNFLEEWFSYTTDGPVIRGKAYLKVTMRMDESSYNGGLGGARAMGYDHPHSWYRPLPTGGRYFYTGVGHRSQNFAGGTANPRFLRRQLYNAILWVAKYDSLRVYDTATVAISRGVGHSLSESKVTISGSNLTVSLLKNVDHSVELMSVDGKRVAFEQGDANRTAHTFTGLRAGIYAVAVTTPSGRSSSLVTVQ